jgi:glutathione synthase/RimK-type ligase-like ATP-grasp enzyme
MAVAEALSRKGAEVTAWATSDFPSRSDESILFVDKGEKTLQIHGADLDLTNPVFDVVWRRRPAFVVDRDTLHPADRAFAESECGMFRRSLLRLIAPSAFWVNPPEGAALAGSKILQHETARKVGLSMPETLFTNSPKEIRQFLRHGRKVIYKPLSESGWMDRDSRFLSYTALLTEETLVSDAILRQTPGIFQELVPKAYELRITAMGTHVLAAKVLSQETEKGKLDWRQSYDELRFEPTNLPPEIEALCRALLAALGIVFGCFDFIVTPQGEYIFLEVNEMGQFLFVERYCGLPLLDAFSEFLLQGKVDFEWSPDGVGLRYSDTEFESASLARWNAFRSTHCPIPESLVDEDEKSHIFQA